MRYILVLIVGLLFIGCVGVQKGEYVTYESQEYLFVNDNFLSKSMDCIEFGEMKQGGFDVKYCVGSNYASALVQGFIFEHKYSSFDERFVGATLTFKTKDVFTIQCSSETINDASSGTEYINCMVPKRELDLYSFIIDAPTDITGLFKAAVGDKEVYQGAIDAEGKKYLKQFYKALENRDTTKWKKRTL